MRFLFAFADRHPALRIIAIAATAWAVAAGVPAQETPSRKRPVDDDIIASLARAPLALQFHGDSPAELAKWQGEFRERLQQLLGDSSPPRDWQVVEEDRRELDDHTRYELLLQAADVPALPLYLLVPRAAEPGQRLPAVLCIHGHGDHGHDPIVGRTDLPGVADSIASANYDYGLQFARRGYVVAAPCLTPFGRRVEKSKYGSQDPCAITFVRMQALGQLPITVNLRDLRWALDLLESRPEVDGQRIGCAGLSYGGRMTMMVSALDSRIKVASVSGALNLLQERMTLRHSCGSQMIPGLLRLGDYSEIGSLIAPRPVVWEVGDQDPLIVRPWDARFRERLQRAYRAASAAEQLHFDDFSGGHVWSGRVAFELFDDVLKR